jgi:hypothetical protein
MDVGQPVDPKGLNQAQPKSVEKRRRGAVEAFERQSGFLTAVDDCRDT